MTNASRRQAEEKAELLAERVSVFENAIGALWLAFIMGAISFEDAEYIDRELKAAARVPLLPDWARFTSETQH
jgi:hypothetical protein